MRITFDSAVAAGTYDLTPVVGPTGPTGPTGPSGPTGPTGDPLAIFNYLAVNANECVAWRYVLQEPSPYPTKEALIAQMGQQAYNQKVNWCSYNCPNAFFINGVAWWVNPAWTGAYPQSVGEPPAAWLSLKYA